MKACRWGRSAARAALIQSSRRLSLPGRGLNRSAKERDQVGQVDHLGAGGDQVVAQAALFVGEMVGAGQYEPGEAAWGDRWAVALDAALGDVAVEQVETAS